MGDAKTILSLERAGAGFVNKNESNILLEDINLKIEKGELVGLIGRNGAGKSTLLRCIVRLQDLLQGSVYLMDRNIRSIDPNDLARLIAYVSSGLEFMETMTVRELVSLGRFPYTNWIGRLTDTDIELIDKALNDVGIENLENRKLNEISDGERQKAMIARTLAQNTALIVLDEPTAFLDLPSKYDIINLLSELTRKGKTVVYSTHDLNIALRFSDKIWLIDNKSIHDGSPEDLILDKTIAGIFDSDKIYLNTMTGDFELRKISGSEICLNCDIPAHFYWTSQALQRAGYKITDEDKKVPLVRVEESGNKIIWKIQRFNENLSFTSIYELLIYLKNNHSDTKNTDT
jgi:iron complex transport system ATP-binding protein